MAKINLKKAKKADTTLKKNQREIIAQLDAASSQLDVLERNVYESSNFPEIYFRSMLGYLMGLIQHMGVSDSRLKEWIIDILTVVLPVIEVKVKASLLANIKTMVDCHLDPRIPESVRKPYSDGYFTPKDLKSAIEGSVIQRGYIINLDAIDPESMLSKSPFTKEGRELYFGQFKKKVGDKTVPTSYNVEDAPTDDDNAKMIPMNPYQLTRATDFNAFLWFCTHKGKLPAPTKIDVNNRKVTINGKEFDVAQGNSVSDYLVLNGDTKQFLKEGSTYTSESNMSLLSCLVNCEENMAEIVPVSSDWNSCNWYVDRSRYFKENLTSTISTPRNYGKEFGICNIKYMQPYDYLNWANQTNVDGTQNLLFTILPKPYVLSPTFLFTVKTEWKEEESVLEIIPKFDFNLSLKRILFNPDCSVNENGKYTINPSVLNWASNKTVINKDMLIVDIGDGRYFKYVNRNNYGFVSDSGSTEWLSDCDDLIVECYKGITVYEFNYDYVMGMRIFDPGVVTKRMLDAIFNPNYFEQMIRMLASRCGTKGSGSSYADAKLRLAIAVRQMIEEDQELTDCLFKFDNEMYDELLKQAALDYYNQIPYSRMNTDAASVDMTTVNRILDDFPSEGSPEVQKEVITRAFNQAEELIIEASNNSQNQSLMSSDSRTASNNFCMDMLASLIPILVDSLITPKLLMLLEVNRRLMEGENYNGEALTPENIIDNLKGIIGAVVSEIKDMIIQKLLDYVMSFIKEIVEKITAKYLKEQYDAYLAILTKLLGLFRKALTTLDSINAMLSSRFGSLGGHYNSEDYENIDLDLPTVRQYTSYFDYTPKSKIEEPDIPNC